MTFRNVWINNCTFEGNIARFSAAAIITSNVSIFNSRFLFNRANFSQFIISSVVFVGQDCVLQVHNCTFKDNIAGTAVIASYYSIVFISNSTFTRNGVILSGGALLAYGSTVHVLSSAFNDNVAAYDGGVI